MRSAQARVYLLPYTEPLEATGHHGPARYFCVCWRCMYVCMYVCMIHWRQLGTTVLLVTLVCVGEM